MSSDFCIKCDKELSVYCGPCMDEARAEVERLRASVENLDSLYVSRTDALRECEAALRTVAERQREACAKEIEMGQSEKLHRVTAANSVRATPLVMEGDK